MIVYGDLQSGGYEARQIMELRFFSSTAQVDACEVMCGWKVSRQHY